MEPPARYNRRMPPPAHAATPAAHPLADRVRADVPRVTAIRRDLHAHPELSFGESRTSAIVQRELTDLGVRFTAGLARGTGVVGFIPATIDPAAAPTIALRADMDALPIEEATGAPYASKHAGVMHACGHDGHTAILLGAARAIAASASRPNHVVLVFQPAEEGGAGGKLMCDEGALSGAITGRAVDHVYGLHGWPDVPLGTVATRDGPLLAATDDFAVTIRGKGGHAAYPHLCVDPVVVGAHVIAALQTIASRRVAPTDSVVLTVPSLRSGGPANNIIHDTAEFIGTIRTLRDSTRALAREEFHRIVRGVSEALGAGAEIAWHDGYPATVNDPLATARFRRIARRALPPGRILEREHPTMGGEDFSYYGAHAKACFFFLGLRPPGPVEWPGLHTPRFDFNDEALPVGVELMARLALEPVENDER